MSDMVSNLSDDVVVQQKGNTFNVLIGPMLLDTGWRGGQWVKYIDPGALVDQFVVEKSNGNDVCGFLAFPSENYTQVWGATQNYIGRQYRIEQAMVSGGSTVALFLDSGRFLFLVYETVALNGAGVRAGGPIAYALNRDLKISENGLLCNDSDVNLAAAGVTTPHVVGICSAVPDVVRNGNRLGLDLHF